MSNQRPMSGKPGRLKRRLQNIRFIGGGGGDLPPKPITSPLRILRRHQVLERVGLSAMQLWRKEKAGDFPRSVRLGPNSVGYLEHEINEWIRRRAAERGAPDGSLSPKPV